MGTKAMETLHNVTLPLSEKPRLKELIDKLQHLHAAYGDIETFIRIDMKNDWHPTVKITDDGVLRFAAGQHR